MLSSTKETLSDEQAVTADAISTYVIDLLPSGGAIGAGAAGGPSANTTRNLGSGEVLYLYAWIRTTFDSAADSTSLIVSLESDDNTSLSTATVHWTSPDFEQAELVAGVFIINGQPIPPGTYQRYLGVRYNVGAEENFTVGKITTWLSNIPPSDGRIFASGRLTGIN